MTLRTNACSRELETGDNSVQDVLNIIFTKSVWSDGYTRAHEYRDKGHEFVNLEQVIQYNVESAHVASRDRKTWVLANTPLESQYWWSIETAEGAKDLLTRVLACKSCAPDQGSFYFARDQSGVLRKAILQRDLLQAYSVLYRATEVAADVSLEPAIQLLLGKLASAFSETLFTPAEYEQLVALLPGAIPASFTENTPSTLVENYLPRGAIANDATWYVVPPGPVPFVHFSHFRARSFVKVFMRSQDSKVSFDELRSYLFERYGQDLHATSVSDPVPKQLETMLVRTFGVVLKNGNYKDSHWPEEVLLRIFKYPRYKIDRDTSDFRGTLFFQYKLSREELLRDPSSLGLQRIRDDDNQFFGFHGETMDPRNSYGAAVTTMRSNCIGCHEELFYGLNTVFSFERDPRVDRSVPSSKYWRVVEDGTYRLQTPEFKDMWERLEDAASQRGEGRHLEN